MSSNSKPDIIWIIIDGIRPDKLRSCGNLNRPYLFIDEILLKGTLFTTVISSGANSKTAMHAAFTSMYPSINKMNAYNPKFQKKLDPLAPTITDILKHNGYKTFRYQDVVKWQSLFDSEQIAPTSGFDVWESSGHGHIGETPKHSFSTPKRDAFIADFNNTIIPKFAYIHLLTSHDLNVEGINEKLKTQGRFGLTSAIYERNLLPISEDFKDVWDKLQIKDDTLVIISTDHGARLDFSDIFEEEQKYGMQLRDINMNTFCSFIGLDIPKQKINRMVRSIDIVPTILEIVDIQPFFGQGRSLLPLIRGEELPELYAFMETGGIYERPPSYEKSNVWGVRTERWKYRKHLWRGEWLIDLKNDPDEKVNLIGKGLPIEDKLRKLLKEELIENTKTVEQILTENAKARNISKYFTKHQIIPEVSLCLLVQDKNHNLINTIDSILAQICVYFELLVLDFTSDGSIEELIENYKDYRIIYQRFPPNTPIISILNVCKGKYISYLSSNLTYNPLFLYELRKILQNNPNLGLVYSDYKFIDQVKFEKIINTKTTFHNKKNVGYSFLARKEIIDKNSNLKINIFHNNHFNLPLMKNGLVFHYSKTLGNISIKVGKLSLFLHSIYKFFEVGKKQGLRLFLMEGVNLFKKYIKQFGLKRKKDFLYKYSKEEWREIAQRIDKNDWEKEYTDVWKIFMSTKEGKEILSYEDNIANRVGMQLILKEILQGFSKNNIILEVGGGTGIFSIHLAQKGYNIICTDCNVEALEIGKEKVLSFNEEIKRKISFKKAFTENLPFSDNYFDVIVCMEVLEHLVEPKKAISEFHRVLKNGGKVFITVPYKDLIYSPLHLQEFTLKDIRKYFEEYFKIELIKLCPFLLGQSNNQIFLVGVKRK